MNNKGQINSEDLRIQGLIDNYLRFRSSNAIINNDKHLDEDTLTAFVEGNLSPRESAPALRHLVDCSFCRHVTAELVRLDFAFADQEAAMPATARQSEPTSVSDVLSNLLSRIFGTSDSAVLAHQEPEEEKKEEDKKD
jgi:hypothetical protein